ncbi:acyltransferase [Leptospira wolffii]|uniref:acyltransferase family protein n=1 Tax=Leptospira wolffii TaxID=409998 RepID=UPI00108428C8|nr:acyltransferase [Leptospira wolffii]TGL52672.1 acyltransferase [Leptospira wolffii]
MFSYIFSIFKKKEDENESLNGLRALAILLVVFFHTWGIFNGIHSDFWKNIFDNFNSGVDLFFILSGYLIYGGLLRSFRKNGSIDIRGFFIGRALRILPAFYFALAIVYLYTKTQVDFFKIHPPSDPNVANFWKERAEILPFVWSDLIFLSNYFPCVMVVDWSLSVENHFYLLLPVLILFGLFRLESKQRVALYCFVYFLPGIARIIGALSGLDYDFVHKTHNRFDSILVGIIVAELISSYKIVLNRNRVIVLSVILIAGLVFGHSYPIQSWIGKSIALNSQNISYGILLFLCMNQKTFWTAIFESPIFRPIARISYSMYLWNIVGIGVGAGMVARTRENFSTIQTLQIIGISFLVTFISSWIFYLAVEKPFVDWKNRIGNRKARKTNS